MNYERKDIQRIKKRLSGEGDDYKLPYEKYLEMLSRGGKLERSYKKRVGNIVNKNLNKRYNIVNKVLKKIWGK